VKLANSTADYALISDSARLDLIAAHECQFRVVKPNPKASTSEIGTDFEVEYAIAFAHDSPFLQQFDLALEQLELSGKLRALIENYWTDYCAAKREDNENGDGDDSETNGASSLAPHQWPLWAITGISATIILMLTAAVGSARY